MCASFVASDLILGLTGLCTRTSWGVVLAWGLCCLLHLGGLAVEVAEVDEKGWIPPQSLSKSQFLLVIACGSPLLELIKLEFME